MSSLANIVHLKSFIENGNIEEAIQQTCECIRHESMDSLEQLWMALIAKLSESHSMDVAKWYDTCLQIYQFIQNESCDVKLAFHITGKLLILYHRYAYFLEFKMPVLREKIISHYPENGLLTNRGIELFEEVLPQVEDEKRFAHRLLCGMLALLTTRDQDVGVPTDPLFLLRLSMEYFVRKKINMHMTSRTFCPSIEEQQKGEILWFLWGALLLFYKQHTVLNTIFQLCTRLYAIQSMTTTRSRKSKQWMDTNAYVGFLYAGCYFSRYTPTAASPWSQGDRAFLDKVQENGIHMWQSLCAAQTTRHQTTLNENEDVDIFMSFYPRFRPSAAIASDPEILHKIKTIRVKQRNSVARGRHDSFTDNDNDNNNDNGSDNDNDEDNSDDDFNVPARRPTSPYYTVRAPEPSSSNHLDSRHRRIHPGKAREGNKKTF